MGRQKYNGVATGSAGALTALTLGASLTNAGTTITFNAALTYNNGTAVPTLASPNYIALTILDANGLESEIVWLTAYTSGGTTGTIARGQEGSTGVAHSSGDKVVHGPTVTDFPAFDYSAEILKDSPLWWPRLRETSGTSLADASGNSRTATLTGSGATLAQAGPIRSDGTASKSIKLTGSAYVNVPYATWMNASPFTYKCWVQGLVGGGNMGIIGRWSGSGGGVNSSMLWVNASSPTAIALHAVTSTTTYDCSALCCTGPWAMIDGTWDGSNFNIYINGALAGTLSGAGTLVTGAGDLQVGTYQSSAQPLTNHLIAEPALFGTALSATRISAHYAAAMGF